jgi:hypothetical protein
LPTPPGNGQHAEGTVVAAVNVDPVLPHREFASVTQVTVCRKSEGVADDEQRAVIDVATGRRSSWTADWPAFRKYS